VLGAGDEAVAGTAERLFPKHLSVSWSSVPFQMRSEPLSEMPSHLACHRWCPARRRGRGSPACPRSKSPARARRKSRGSPRRDCE
jgi:hypothetical protein